MNYSIISLYRQINFSLPSTKMIHLYFDKKTARIDELLSAISVIIAGFDCKLSHFSSQTSNHVYPMCKLCEDHPLIMPKTDIM